MPIDQLLLFGKMMDGNFLAKSWTFPSLLLMCQAKQVLYLTCHWLFSSQVLMLLAVFWLLRPGQLLFSLCLGLVHDIICMTLH